MKQLNFDEKIEGLKKGLISLSSLPIEDRGNIALVKAALFFNCDEMLFADDKIKNNKSFIMDDNILYIPVKYIGESLKNDFEVMKKMISFAGLDIADVGESLKKNKELALVAIEANPRAFAALPISFRSDESILENAMEKEKFLFVYAGKNLKSDKKVVLKHLDMDMQLRSNKIYINSILKAMSKNLKNDIDIALSVIEKNANSFMYLGSNIKKDKKFISLAIKNGNVNVLKQIEVNKKKPSFITNTEFVNFIMEEMDEEGLLTYPNFSYENLKILLKNQDYKNCYSELIKNKSSVWSVYYENEQIGAILLRKIKEKELLNEIKASNVKAKKLKF